jgi:hypothetical protein
MCIIFMHIKSRNINKGRSSAELLLERDLPLSSSDVELNSVVVYSSPAYHAFI